MLTGLHAANTFMLHCSSELQGCDGFTIRLCLRLTVSRKYLRVAGIWKRVLQLFGFEYACSELSDAWHAVSQTTPVFVCV